MPISLQRILTVTFSLLIVAGASGARIKDITTVKGARSNQLYGYGVVVGLAGQGDSKIEYTQVGILNALETLGIRVDKADKSRNIAAVIVTADIGPFAKEGSKIDVLVSSAGDADSLQGGVLLQAPLIGADGKVYALDLKTGQQKCSSRSNRVDLPAPDGPTRARVSPAAMVSDRSVSAG